MFNGLLKIAPRCDACGVSFEDADVGDGASVFALFIVGFLAMVVFLLVAVAFNHPPIWVHLLIQLPMIPIATIACIRPLKGVLFALQFKHDAQEARLDD
ncbi:DUF983 domain-containing protein [Maricaulis sp.]|uniref:DUF983 domain-containing protein n=1 Tax=unclassified Maricaulis TaxID=2632371 RepID=UPI0025C4D364|nr:DUF983 domain-containing protein [Maricaulis sp.]